MMNILKDWFSKYRNNKKNMNIFLEATNEHVQNKMK